MVSRKNIERALKLIRKGRSNYDYFFTRLDDPDWIEPLLNEGFFKHPPPLLIKGDTIRFSFWPESQYLSRMANRNPNLVLRIITQEIPDTDNSRIHHDFAEASLNMPAYLSAKLVNKESAWLKKQKKLFFALSVTLGKLISHLAKGGEIDAALKLAVTLLEVLPDPKREEKDNLDKTYRPSPKPTVRFDQWEYGEIFKRSIPDLVKTASIKAVELICDLLEKASRYSARNASKEAPLDYSYIWRPAIENHAQNRFQDLRGLLVTSLRDACEVLIRDGKEDVKKIIGILERNKYPWHIFRRISLHLLRLFPETTGELISERLTNYYLFDKSDFHHEYSLLLNDHFKSLSREKQEIILEWIDAGPDLEKYKKSRTAIDGEQPTDEDAQHYKKFWQRNRLAWFKEAIPPKWKKRYEEMVSEMGKPKHPEFASYSNGVWDGPTSPIDAENLKKLPIPEIIDYLKTWKPTGEYRAPSSEGLGQVLTSIVSESPEAFSNKADHFKGLDPTYVRALLYGFRDAINNGKRLNWSPVLSLCSWVIQQPKKDEDENLAYMDKDPHWGWTHKTIADLLSSGLKKDDNSILVEFRKTIWDLLQPLTEDPEPTPEYEAKYLDSNMDPSNMAINTIRGEAMHALIHYALWVRRHFEKEPSGKEKLDRGFQEMPEVREILEAHLDTSNDPSLAIRSVYGQWFPWIQLIDSMWAKINVNKIFPSSVEQRSYWDAAWNTYITHCGAYDLVLEVLKDQYALAIERLSEKTGESESIIKQTRLAQHLMAFYWRGKVGLDGLESLLVQFYEKASPFIKGDALEFIGQSVKNTEGKIQTEILQRIIKLWEKRLGEAKNAQDVTPFSYEMKAFGWWFASSKFDDQWAIENLLEALKLTQNVEPDSLVVERLSIIAEKIPLEAVQCLDYMAKGDRENWKIHGWIDEAKTILAQAMKSGGKAADLAEDLIHNLGSRGFFQFRNLLKDH